MSEQNQEIAYNQAKIWQIALFALNNMATNIFYLIMLYVSYYANGVAGIAVVTVSFLLTAMRIFDGVTDPIVGLIIDKTNTKFGKYRPLIAIGNIIMLITVLILFNTVHLVPESIRIIYFILIYGIYIIGYTCQTSCTRAAQACLTNDPKQRPLFSLFDGIYSTLLLTINALYVSNYLIGKYGNFSEALFREFAITAVIVSLVLTILAMIGIAEKDRTEFFNVVEDGPKVQFKDYITILKSNKAARMLMLAACTAKFGKTIHDNATPAVIIFGIVAGDYALNGTVNAYTTIPSMIVLMFVVKQAGKLGQKRALVVSTIASMITMGALGVMILSGSMNTLNFTNLNLFTIVFAGVFILMKGFSNATSAIVIPMVADCADYQVYLDGKQVPGMLGTMFSFIDKVISSFSITFVGIVLAGIGFTEVLPTVDTAFTTTLMYAGTLLYAGVPFICYIISLVALKFYPLDAKMMSEIQIENAKRKDIIA